MFNFTNEIERFCEKTARKMSENLPPTVPIILNYNINVFEEIPQLVSVFNYEGYQVREISSPVIIYYKLQDKKLKNLLVPGVFIQRQHFSLVDGQPKPEADFTETDVKMILTRQQIVRVMSEKPLSDHKEIQTILNGLQFDDRLSGILEDYLSLNLAHMENIPNFESEICFYPELDILTYVYRSTLNLLNYSKIGNILNEIRSKTNEKTKPLIPRISAASISRIIEVGSKPTKPIAIPSIPAIEDDMDSLNSKNKEGNLELLTKVFDNYMYQTKEVFSIISSSGRSRPLKLQEVLYSCKEKSSVENLAYNEATDPVSRNSKPEDRRTVGNPNGNLPIFPSAIMEHILLGNFPFMLIYAKSVDEDNIFNDPLYHLKRYMLEKAVECIETLKVQSSTTFTMDEWYVIKESSSIANKKMIECLYLNGSKLDKMGYPTGITYKGTYEMCFIDFSLMNAYLKFMGLEYNNDLNQFINYISPIDID